MTERRDRRDRTQEDVDIVEELGPPSANHAAFAVPNIPLAMGDGRTRRFGAIGAVAIGDAGGQADERRAVEGRRDGIDLGPPAVVDSGTSAFERSDSIGEHGAD